MTLYFTNDVIEAYVEDMLGFDIQNLYFRKLYFVTHDSLVRYT